MSAVRAFVNFINIKIHFTCGPLLFYAGLIVRVHCSLSSFQKETSEVARRSRIPAYLLPHLSTEEQFWIPKPFSGAFAKFRKATSWSSVCLSVCVFVRPPGTTRPHWADSDGICYTSSFSKICRENSTFLKIRQE